MKYWYKSIKRQKQGTKIRDIKRMSFNNKFYMRSVEF